MSCEVTLRKVFTSSQIVNESLVEKAKVFANGNYEIYHYIICVLHDKEFQKNPHKLLATMEEKLGLRDVEKWMTPESDVLQFFKINL